MARQTRAHSVSSDCDKVAAVPLAAPERRRRSSAPSPVDRLPGRIALVEQRRDLGFDRTCTPASASAAAAARPWPPASAAASWPLPSSTPLRSDRPWADPASSRSASARPWAWSRRPASADRAFSRPAFPPASAAARGAGVGHDRRLFGDLADGVIDRPGFGDLLDQRLRIFLLAGLDAGGDLGQLIGRRRFRPASTPTGGASSERARKRHQSPPEHEDVQGDRRNQCLVDLHLHDFPCSTSVTSATPLEAGAATAAPSPHDRSVIGLLVAPHEDPLVERRRGLR